jgi:tRNA 2-thiouridine synthesizing protein D
MLILLCDSPFQHESVEHAISLAQNAIEKGHEVDLYLMMDGVYNPLIPQSGEPFHMESISVQMKKLIKMGATISGCRVCMEIRGVTQEDLPDGVDLGGIFDLSDSIAEANVILSMTGVR